VANALYARGAVQTGVARAVDFAYAERATIS
jgi:hypothetical protein